MDVSSIVVVILNVMLRLKNIGMIIVYVLMMGLLFLFVHRLINSQFINMICIKDLGSSIQYAINYIGHQKLILHI